jgi:hypothetical protein
MMRLLAKLKLKENKMRVLVDDFYNKVANELKRVYFPSVIPVINDNYCGVRYSVELFSNGCISYDSLLNKLSKQCNTSKSLLHCKISNYINADFNFTIKGTK